MPELNYKRLWIIYISRYLIRLKNDWKILILFNLYAYIFIFFSKTILLMVEINWRKMLIPIILLFPQCPNHNPVSIYIRESNKWLIVNKKCENSFKKHEIKNNELWFIIISIQTVDIFNLPSLLNCYEFKSFIIFLVTFGVFWLPDSISDRHYRLLRLYI